MSKGVKDEDFQRVFNLRKTIDVTWNGETLTDKQLEENYEHIYVQHVIHFLFLVCDLFKIDITHNYCSHMMSYRAINPTSRHFSSKYQINNLI